VNNSTRVVSFKMKSLPDGSENSVSIRDERGRYLKGIAGGPGRPPGSRNRLTEDFLGDLHAAWLERGREAIDRVIDERPEAFLGIVAKTIDVRRNTALQEPSNLLAASAVGMVITAIAAHRLAKRLKRAGRIIMRTPFLLLVWRKPNAIQPK
jgi:hypothetical protein